MICFVCFISVLSGNGLAFRWMTTLSLLLSDFAGAAGYTVSIVLPQSSASCQRNPSQNPFTQQQHTSYNVPPSLCDRMWWMGIGGTFSSSLLQVTVVQNKQGSPWRLPEKLSCTSTFPVWQDSVSSTHCARHSFISAARRGCEPRDFVIHIISYRIMPYHNPKRHG